MTVSVKGLTALTTSGDQAGILILQLMSLMRRRCGEPGNQQNPRVTARAMTISKSAKFHSYLIYFS